MRRIGQPAEHVAGAGEERLHLLFETVAGRSGAVTDVVHRGDELADPARQVGLDLGEVLGRAAEHFLQQHVRLAQPLEQRRGIVAQHAVRFHHLGHGGGRGRLRALDRPRAVESSSLTVRVIDAAPSALASLIRPAISSLFCYDRLGEGHALLVDRLHARCG